MRIFFRIGACAAAVLIAAFLVQQTTRLHFDSIDQQHTAAASVEEITRQIHEYSSSESGSRTTNPTTVCGEICPSDDVTLPDHYESLFYHADMRPFLSEAICGSPFNYLPEYDNPCWISGTVPSSTTVAFDDHTAHGSRDDDVVCTLRCLPRVHLVGFAKSGTGDLFKSITKHPYLVRTRKEPLFWSFGRFGRNDTIERYLSVYDDKVDEIRNVVDISNGRRRYPKLMLDASSTKVYYLDGWREVPGQEHLDEPLFTTAMTIRALTPQAKIIIIMRNPTDRTYSRYRMFCNPCTTTQFHEFVSDFISEMNACLKLQTLRGCAYNYTFFKTRMPYGMEKHSTFIRASLYYVYVKDWLDVFPRDQVYFVQSEEFFANRTPVVREIMQFLDLDLEIMTDDLWQLIANKNPSNVGVLKGRLGDAMMNETRELLDDFFRPYNRLLADLLNDDRFLWNRK